MKKVLLFILVFLILAGCGKDTEDHTQRDVPTEQTVEQTIDLTIPKDYVMVSAGDVYDTTLNPDESVTYHLTQAQYDVLLTDVREETEAALQVIMKDIPTFTSIDHDEEFQSFTVETSNVELSFREAASMITLFAYGKMYNAYFGNPDAIIYITYTHDGTEVYSCNSGQLK